MITADTHRLTSPAGCCRPARRGLELRRITGLLLVLLAAWPAAAARAERATPEWLALWNSYRDGIGAVLQPGCEPTHVPASTRAPARGMVILLHGFTACPQQFFELAPQLAAAGYEVLIPLLPGHGRAPAGDANRWIDDVSAMPGEGQEQVYHQFLDVMNAIAAAFPGPRAIAGLSLGGSMTVAALIRAPDLYDRGLVYTPLFRMSGIGRLPVETAPGWFPTDWGAGCVDERTRPQPRAGICQFRIEHVRAALAIGRFARQHFDAVRRPVQFVAVTADAVASPEAIQSVAERNPRAVLCYMPSTVNHSLLSRFDSPDEDKYWIPTVNQRSVDFLTEGTPFPTRGASMYPPHPLCIDRP
jgi:pimeloyl-ACP methyl ester carboxylesterase